MHFPLRQREFSALTAIMRLLDQPTSGAMINSTYLKVTPAPTSAEAGCAKLTAGQWVLPHVCSYAKKLH
jgi:hypothetical protein